MHPPQIFSLTGHAFGLTVSGVQVIDLVPTDIFPIRWDWPSASGSGGISFTLLDEGQTALPAGAVVRLTDNVNNDLLFSGPLVNRRFSRYGGPYRRVECAGVGWGFYLDNRAVDEWVWPMADTGPFGGGPGVRQLIGAYGGPILGETPEVRSYGGTAEPGTAVKTTLRSALEQFTTAININNNPMYYYVDNDRHLHWGQGPEGEADIVGTATSIGDQGALIPEGLTYELGDESYKGWAYAWNVGGTAIGIATNGGWVAAYTTADWDAGEPSTTYDVPYDWVNPLVAASYELHTYHNTVTAITFSTTEDSSFRPHQEITVDDSLLTGGTAETWYIEAVSGTIDHRNVIELSVSIGARQRSLVQTVASNL